MRVLIIENNALVARYLQQKLRPHYSIDIALSGQQGLVELEVTSYDVILLAAHLRDIDSQIVCQTLRNRGIKTPALVFSGTDRLHEEVAFLDCGADDYLVRPIHLPEIEARIRAVLRRGCQCNTPGKIAHEDLLLDPAARTVCRGNQSIRLRRKEFELLEYLMRNQRRTLTREMILEHIWDNSQSPWGNVVDVHIKHLRDKVDRPFGSRFIKTVHGIGYKFESSDPRP